MLYEIKLFTEKVWRSRMNAMPIGVVMINKKN